MQLFEQVTSIVSRTWKLIPHAKRVYIKINLPRSSAKSNYEKKHIFYNSMVQFV